jgi:hypothetical protein
MCYNRRDHGFEEEARSRLRQHEEEEAGKRPAGGDERSEPGRLEKGRRNR